MGAEFILVFGGVGLFLLGMIILTQGLRGLAGNALRRWLSQYTKTPLRGAVAGTLTTAIIQSSSATTVTAVGFVGAGLLTFPQGLGIVFGANVGTTITGWLVAILGFKLNLGLAVMPLVLIGTLIRLFSHSQLRHFGWALAGFSLLFVGIDVMQQGMAHFKGSVTPEFFPDDTLFGRFQLILLGIFITFVTQSSSAGVAAALVALSAGNITFSQAAAMVIGMNVGTTLTAALATLGGSTAMRQTGYAHVIYNIMTGVMAFFLLGPFAVVVNPLVSSGGAGNAQIALVAFHTTFNIVGVILVLPFASPFSRLIIRLVPEHGPPLLQRLDERLLRDPATAVDATAATIRDISALLFRILADMLDPQKRQHLDKTNIAAIDEALEATRSFLEQIRTDPTDQHAYWRHLSSMHALDHLIRLSHRCTQETRINVLYSERRLRRLSAILHASVVALLQDGDLPVAEKRLDRLHTILRDQGFLYREGMVVAASQQHISAFTMLQRLDSIRWLHRVADHLWRILYHLRRAEQQAPAQPEAREATLELEED